MSLQAHSSARPLRGANPARLARMRQTSLAVLTLLVLEYGIGMYVNLYVTVPRTDHGHRVATAIASGPVILSLHIAVGLLIAVGSIGVLVQAVRARHPAAITGAALGLFAVAFASAICCTPFLRERRHASRKPT